MTVDFLSPSAADGVAARSPMEREALAAGGRLELRDGWHVAVDYGSPERERERCTDYGGWADLSHLGKLELQGSAPDLAAIVELEPGLATRANDAWWCPLTPEKVMVISEASATGSLRERLEGVDVIDLTAAQGALAIAGPLAREVLARLTAIDLRPQVTPVRGWRPGSVARTPAAVLREGEDRFLMLFGAALGRYVWAVVADAAEHLGGGPVGLDALEEAAPRA